MIDLSHVRVGDQLVFADGTRGICTVSYDNGGGQFLRWAVPGKAWSESDVHCCVVSMYRNGRRGGEPETEPCRHPKDIVDIIKPPLHELQDEIDRLRRKLKASRPASDQEPA